MAGLAAGGGGGGVEGQKVCGFFLAHKGRVCRMLVKAGRRYCGQHLTEDTEAQSSGQHKRIPCPLDPKHSCFEYKLERHLAICNARLVTDLPHLSLHCNLRGGAGEAPPKVLLAPCRTQCCWPSSPRWRGYTQEYHILILTLGMSYLNPRPCIAADVIGTIGESILRLGAVEAVIAGSCGNPSVVRHLRQTSSLLAHLQAANLLDTATRPACYVEFGAGRGQLTHLLTEAVTDPSKALFVMVERGAQRYKYDTKMKQNQEINLKRIRADIEHLSLAGVEGLGDYDSIVGLGKHLCGAASDLALRCLCQHPGTAVAGAVLALCCHHRCAWESYCGLEVLQGLGVLPLEFYVLTALTGWATCNSRDVPRKEETPSELTNENGFEASLNKEQHSELSLPTEAVMEKKLLVNRYTRLRLSAQHRAEVGRKAKQVLDYGRLQYLGGQGFVCRLVQYVTMDTTPENVALIAQRVPR
ncbi:tRNA:m(4)X modification enzyme TRM13 [Chionoecetes opilio]|uniref:tRNA:m(4)X modification enzyme TRM13 n=1 Tax=Chionoecetes opilio TaxID=41210 RepID=A0A8J5CQP2_CHIOP|nr:tRNA:m(4)X modification enzyme TRM13 [Chionoecetes opilio]